MVIDLVTYHPFTFLRLFLVRGKRREKYEGKNKGKRKYVFGCKEKRNERNKTYFTLLSF